MSRALASRGAPPLTVKVVSSAFVKGSQLCWRQMFVIFVANLIGDMQSESSQQGLEYRCRKRYRFGLVEKVVIKGRPVVRFGCWGRHCFSVLSSVLRLRGSRVEAFCYGTQWTSSQCVVLFGVGDNGAQVCCRGTIREGKRQTTPVLRYITTKQNNSHLTDCN